jgi:hypothetical protein
LTGQKAPKKKAAESGGPATFTGEWMLFVEKKGSGRVNSLTAAAWFKLLSQRTVYFS